MKLTLLGTGCPVVSTQRFGPAHWVEHDGTNVLVDCGSGVTQRMLAAGYDGRDLDALLLTHLHSDHIVDLFQLVLSSWHQGRDRPHNLYGPPGTKLFVDRLFELWADELEQRIAWEQRKTTAALEVNVHELSPHEELTVGGLSVRVVKVDHRPVKHAFGFVFDDGSSRLAMSGDTRPSDALISAASRADVLLHEVFAHEAMPGPGGLRTAETLSNVASYHTLASEVGTIAEDAQVGKLVLTHIVPPDVDVDRLHEVVARDFDGPVVVGEDLMVVQTR